ncbi:MAG: hypothetical protein QM783_14250 [Phycisphaerales bacterium]
MKGLNLVVSLGLLAAAAPAAFGQFGYGLVGQFNLPAGTAAWDVDGQGRAWALVGNSVYAEATPGSGSFGLFGSVPAGTVSMFGGSFIRVNDAGTQVAIGDGNFNASASVHFVSTAALNAAGPGGAATQSVVSGNFDGTWNGNHFYLTGAGSDFVPFVSRVDFTDVTGSPVATRIITNGGGGSGGVAISGGSLFAGVGYGGGGLSTGDIRVFDLLAADSAPSPVQFSSGVQAAGGPVLSAWPLAFDGVGRLLVGGGDGFGGTTDIGYVAVIDLQSGVRQLLSPAGDSVTYGVDFNPVLSQIYVSEGGVVYRYAVPAPGAVVTLAMAGLAAARRRRGA